MKISYTSSFICVTNWLLADIIFHNFSELHFTLTEKRFSSKFSFFNRFTQSHCQNLLSMAMLPYFASLLPRTICSEFFKLGSNIQELKNIVVRIILINSGQNKALPLANMQNCVKHPFPLVIWKFHSSRAKNHDPCLWKFHIIFS